MAKWRKSGTRTCWDCLVSQRTSRICGSHSPGTRTLLPTAAPNPPPSGKAHVKHDALWLNRDSLEMLALFGPLALLFWSLDNQPPANGGSERGGKHEPRAACLTRLVRAL